ncbi:MAG: PorT family protein [Paludibacteraceae bacterium]|nr:PorT family protein [Paludibacteraceae bacterium]
MRKILLIICVLCLSGNIWAQRTNHPLSDDKLMHYGGFLGVNIPSYSIRPENFYAPAVGYGLTLGGYVDVRLAKYLNLRLCPSINFNTINIKQLDKDSVNMLVMPFAVPLQLKWSAERKVNYRPFVMVGGGVSFDFNTVDEDKKKILTKKLNYFVEGGFGCDFYTKWFRCSPEIKYQLGFNNMLAEQNEDGSWGNNWTPAESDKSYMEGLEKLIYHQVSLIIHFGSL